MKNSRPLLTRRAAHRVLPLEARLMFDAAAAADAARVAAEVAPDATPDAAHAEAPGGDTYSATPSLQAVAGAAGLSAEQQQAWTNALAQVNAVLATLPDRNDYAALLSQSFGTAGTDARTFAERVDALADLLGSGGLQLQVELRSGAELQGAFAAYAAHGPDGRERIYVNADWVARGVGEHTLAAVLLEEAGHALDQRLNAGADTAGDEGERFSALVRGEQVSETHAAGLLADADQTTLVIDGERVHVEFAELSVPFPEGYIGTRGSSNNSADGVLSFATLGITRASFFQDSATSSFSAQGNDIPGGLRLTLTSGQVITVAGAINWRVTAGNALYCFGFIPEPATSPVSFGYGANSTFTISNASNFALELVGVSYSTADNSNINGNAATNGLLDALNAYLTTVRANDPNGPVTVATLNTTDTTPTLSGTATLGAGESLTVAVNGVTYTTSTGLTVGAGAWSLTVPNGNALALGTYSVTATIANASGYTLTDSSVGELVISAPDAVAPVVGAGQSFSYAENQAQGSVLGTVAATDAVGVTAYRFAGTGTGTSADGYFSIGSSGQISLTAAGAAAASNDHETTPNSFTHGVQAGDAAGNWSSAVNVTLNVTDVDDTAPVVTSSQSFSYTENQVAGSVLGTVAATDAVGVTGYRFGSTGTATSADGYYTINSSGQISLTAAGAAAATNDHETTPNSFTHTVQARDAVGNWSTAVNVTLNVTDVDDTAPVVTGSQSFSYTENQVAGSVLGTVAATDAVGVTGYRFGSTGTATSADGYYTINSSGQISLTAAGAAAATNDHETTPNSFTHGVQARDAAGNWSTAVNVTLNVTDVDDTAPVVTGSQSFSYTENQLAGSVLGTVTATDAVGVNGYRFGSTGTATSADGYYTINSSGQISLTAAGAAAAPNDHETTPNSFTHAVQARDAAGNWSSAANVTLNVTDLADGAGDTTPPAVGAGQSFGYVEGQLSGAVLGTVVATDAVGVTDYRFSSTGTATSADGYYTIDSSGQISLTAAGAAAATNDHETTPNSFTHGVQAGDAAGNWSSAVNVTLNVTDVDDTAPVVTSSQSFSYPENQVAGSVLGTVIATDAVGVTGYRFGSTGTTTSADGYYTINGSGQISLTAAGAAAAPNDHETTPNSFTYGVQARDAAGNWSSATNVTLDVSDIVEAAPVSPDSAQAGEDQPASGNVLTNDAAAGAQVVSYTVNGNTLAAGTATTIAGVGQFSLAADGSFQFTPLLNWNGAVPTITYLTDGGQSATLSLVITAANDAPALPADALATFQGVPWEGQLPAGTDAEGDTLTYTLVQAPAHGSVTLASDGSYRYVPDAGYSGTDSFQVQVSDGQGGTSLAWVNVTVAPAPTLSLPPEWDLGTSASDRRTTADVITLAGIGTPGVSLQLYSPSGAPLGTTVVDGNGHWSVAGIDLRTLTGDGPGAVAGAPGAYSFSVRATLPGGALSEPVQITVQRELPVVILPSPEPAAPAPAPAPAPLAAPEVPPAVPEAPRPFDSALRSETRPDQPLVPARMVEATPAAFMPAPAREVNEADIYTRPSGFQIMVNPAPEPSLKLFRGLDDQVAKLGTSVNLQVPADTFIHTSVHETVTLQAVLADGRPLPRWLHFDGKSGTLSGEMPAEWREDLVIRVLARDSQGREASATMRLKVGAAGASEAGRPVSSLSRQLMQGHAHRAPARA